MSKLGEELDHTAAGNSSIQFTYSGGLCVAEGVKTPATLVV